MNIFEVSVTLSMPVVFLAIGIWSAVKKLGILNRFSIVVIIAYFVFNVVEAILYVKRLNERPYVETFFLYLQSDFFLLNVFCMLSLGLFLLVYGTIYLAKRARSYSTQTAYTTCNKTFGYHKTPAIGDAFLAAATSSPKSARLEANTPIRRVILIMAFLYGLVGMGYVTFFSLTTASIDLQPPTILFQEEEKTFCKNSAHENNKSKDYCLSAYQAFAYLNYSDFDDQMKKRCGNHYLHPNSECDYFSSMRSFHSYWEDSIKYWENVLCISITFLFSFFVIFSFVNGVGQRFLGFCFSPFKKLWRWIKTGR